MINRKYLFKIWSFNKNRYKNWIKLKRIKVK